MKTTHDRSGHAARPTAGGPSEGGDDRRNAGLRLPAKLVGPIVLGTLLNALNSSMIAVALVSIQQAFAPHGAAQERIDTLWLVSGLYLATAAGQPTMGRLADRFGAKRIFCIGLAIVLVASSLAPFAPTLGWLIASRVALGIGTSAAYPAGMAMIRAWSQRHANGATPTGGLGAISIAAQVAVAFGPPLGGALVQFAGWRAIFWINVPIVLAAFLFAWLWIPADPVRRGARARDTLKELDLPGVVLFVLTLASLLLFLQSVTREPDWRLLAATLVLVPLLIHRERQAAAPLIDIRMLADNRPLLGTYLRCVGTYAVFYAIFYALPMWLQEARGLSAADAGLVMLPVAGIGTVTTLLATRIVHRHGPRPVLVIGSAMLCIGSVVMSLMTSSLPIAAIVLLSIMFGIPNGFNNLGNQATLYQSTPHDRIGTASGLYRTAQYVGGSLSFALVGLALGHPASDHGLRELAVVLAVISVLLLLNAVSSRHLDAAVSSVPQQK
ncbi:MULTISPECIES: MFS transporter [Burkholderia]|uniref:MFS transporter n=1 Tax=Burkholderia contaminans TaxID=488447 RepID=A0A2S5DRZ8_9BURK|nr:MULTISPECIES: MFS transporter [Burkholderia]EKS9794718.1 MFS transporter [Burkholderia cepacia]EKS9802673.1 MFS transporter [Burkholderia cepacia]EKS9809179.1 MFS transporter [Burkholderia cepacia]EKS9818040.1 MFS transporter [Burkholderia cepacia]EKS9824035.1 MFS transporter [Burkholderia cepacia]